MAYDDKQKKRNVKKYDLEYVEMLAGCTTTNHTYGMTNEEKDQWLAMQFVVGINTGLSDVAELDKKGLYRVNEKEILAECLFNFILWILKMWERMLNDYYQKRQIKLSS